ncbi:MAG: acyltransferase [Lacibacter sp.]
MGIQTNLSGNTATAEKKESRKFISYIHHFRGIAILFVVACHLLLNWEPDSKMHKVLDLLFGNGTVLFVFIAGYLFQHLTKELNYADYLKKKLQNVILPYFIVSIPIIIYRLYTNDVPESVTDFFQGFLSWPAVKKVFYFIITGAHLQPLWFVPMIALFYLAAPLFFYIDRRPKLYYVLIGFVVLSVFVEREPFINIPKMFVHFISVYMFGMFMSRYKEQFLEFAKKYAWLITLLLAVVLVSNYIFYDAFRNPLNYIQKMLFCAFFIYWLWRFEKFVPSFVSYLANISFGMFFLHYYAILIIKAVYEKVAGEGLPGSLLFWTIDYILVLISTALVINIIKKLFPRRSRNLIGC